MPQQQILLETLELEELNEHIFRGRSVDLGTGRVYGGQVLGQAIQAAQLTVDPQRKVHSAHAYFLRAGDFNDSIIYMVEASRDGRSYSSRTVTALQKGRPIFTLMASFHVDEESPFEYQGSLPAQIDTIDDLLEADLTNDSRHDISILYRRGKLAKWPFMIRYPQIDGAQTPQAHSFFGLKTREPIDSNASSIHRSIFTFASDFSFLPSAMRAVGYGERMEEVMLATICHAIWFHREFRVDEWFYTYVQPQRLGGGRALVNGRIYNAAGELLCSTMQEGVARRRREPTK